MALDRTNMVSLLDVGLLGGGTTSNILEMGDGYTELTEDWGADIESTQYVNMKSAASTLKGYNLSLSPAREHLNDAMQTAINNAFKNFPTGADAETFYYRFYKSDITFDQTEGTGSGECIKVPVVVAAGSTGGAGGDILTSSLQINGNGDVVKGTINISASGTYTFTEA